MKQFLCRWTLGATRRYEVTLLRTADVYGHGPCDLLLHDRLLLSFMRWTAEGVPVYRQPLTFESPSRRLSLWSTPSGLRAMIEMGVHSCSPLAIDLGRGKLDLLVGEEGGAVLYFPREGLSWIDVRSD